MKILVIQLARLGDIYLTWPTLSALRRKYPNAKIDILVRKRFSSAMDGNLDVSNILILDTQKILKPIIYNGDEEKSWNLTDNFLAELRANHYDQIINLSFSMVSSYISQAISNDTTLLRGYSRNTDGTLAILDDESSYFYAQVGTGKSNRVHITHLFAAVADVILQSSDWNYKIDSDNNFQIPFENYWILQMGASQAFKTYGVDKWSLVLTHLFKTNEMPLVLVGAEEEKDLGNELQLRHSNKPILNLIGQTSLKQLAQITNNSECVVASDTMLIHLASLLNKKTLNISIGNVCFWESGPLADESYILSYNSRDELASDSVAATLRQILNCDKPILEINYIGKENPVAYSYKSTKFTNFQWDLVQALYLNRPFPALVDEDISKLALLKLRDAAEVALLQIEVLEQTKNMKSHLDILVIVDEITERIGQWSPALIPLISWFQTLKVRIKPGTFKTIAEESALAFLKLIDIINHMLSQENIDTIENEIKELHLELK